MGTGTAGRTLACVLERRTRAGRVHRVAKESARHKPKHGTGPAAGRTVPTLSQAVTERIGAGRAEREVVPLAALGDWTAPAHRPDPVATIEHQNATRVPELVPIRHARMLVSPFTFYRGAAAIMASDLAQAPSPGLRVQCCGDAHLSNFGVFAAPDRRLVFDLNDFDETLPGPFEWDLKRLVASLVVAARDSGHDRDKQRAAARAAAAGYRTVMAAAARMRFMDLWYARVDVDELFAGLRATEDKATRKAAKKTADKARRRTSVGSLAKLTEQSGDGLRIKELPPLVVRSPGAQREESDAIVRQGLIDYGLSLSPDRRLVFEHYRLQDYARRVVGVGSVGTEAFMVLLVGDHVDDVLFLQVKEAGASVLEPFAGRSDYAHGGERVVQGQRLMQAASDAFLGWITGGRTGRRAYYVRQLRDMKGSVTVEGMPAQRLALYGRICGGALARAHARTGDAARISGYLGDDDSADRAFEQFAVSYADQNEHDYAEFARAAETGRIAVARDS